MTWHPVLGYDGATPVLKAGIVGPYPTPAAFPDTPPHPYGEVYGIVNIDGSWDVSVSGNSITFTSLVDTGLGARAPALGLCYVNILSSGPGKRQSCTVTADLSHLYTPISPNPPAAGVLAFATMDLPGADSETASDDAWATVVSAYLTDEDDTWVVEGIADQIYYRYRIMFFVYYDGGAGGSVKFEFSEV